MSRSVLDQGLSVEWIALDSVTSDVRDAWHSLAERAVEPNPFFAPELLLPAARWLPGGREVRLAVVRQDDELLLALPLVRGRYRRVPVPALLTWRHAHRYVGTPLLRDDAVRTAPGLLLEELARRGPAGWLVLDQLYVDGPVASAFREAATALSATWNEWAVWQRPAVRARTGETYLDETLGARSRRTLRRQRRQLERDVGPVTADDLARAGDRRQLGSALDRFLAMEASGWKGRAGTALANDPRQAAFWREACQEFAAAGDLEMWQLKAGDVVAAQQCHVRQGGTVFHLKTTYDEELRRFSPGVQLELDVLHAFHEDPQLTWLDPCTEPEPGTSSRLYPDTRRLGEALVGLTPGGRLTARLTPWAGRTLAAARRRV